MLKLATVCFLVLLSAVGLAGCISVSTEQVVAEGAHKTFVSPRPPEETFKRIVLGTQRCWAFMDVQSSFDAETRSGRILASATLGAATSTAYLADIKPGAEGATVTLHLHKSMTTLDRNMAAWSGGNFSDCSLH